jgi:hypothetical protein
MVKIPASDRIYTIKEGVGITGALCAGKPCAVAKRGPAPKHGPVPKAAKQ